MGRRRVKMNGRQPVQFPVDLVAFALNKPEDRSAILLLGNLDQGIVQSVTVLVLEG